MIVRTSNNGIDTTQNTTINNNTQQNNTPPEQSISGEAKTPMTIDRNDNDFNNNKLADIKQKVENDKYSLDLDATSQKMAQELLQR